MKILVATNAGGLEDSVSPVFGRCQTYTIVELDGDEIKNVEVVPNQFVSAIHGAGIQAAQFAVSKGIKLVIAGNFGPNVASIFHRAGIESISSQGKVKDIIEKYLKGELKAGILSIPQRRGMDKMPPPLRGMPRPTSGEEEIAMIEEHLLKIENMLEKIEKRIDELKNKGK